MLVSDFFDHLSGWRIIASPAAPDAAPWPQRSQVVRISPDDVFLLGTEAPSVPGDPWALVTPELGFSTATVHDLGALAEQHTGWARPTTRPSLGQGQMAVVPAELGLLADGSTQLLVACAARHELQERLV